MGFDGDYGGDFIKLKMLIKSRTFHMTRVFTNTSSSRRKRRSSG